MAVFFWGADQTVCVKLYCLFVSGFCCIFLGFFFLSADIQIQTLSEFLTRLINLIWSAVLIFVDKITCLPGCYVT